MESGEEKLKCRGRRVGGGEKKFYCCNIGWLMNLVVDVGNTRMKYAFFDEGHFIEAKYQGDCLYEDIERWKKSGTGLHILLSGSGQIAGGTRLLLKELADSFREASPLMPLPLTLGYATPETLGFDRIAICMGAMGLYPERPLLVIDTGTCITFNYVDANGVFLGGNISPGLDMRFRGLHQYTAKLPLVSPQERYGGVGRTTEEAIRNGVMDGMLFEVDGYIRRFMENNRNAKVIITGGNSHFFEGHLLAEVQFCKILGFIGLNEVLQYTKKYN